MAIIAECWHVGVWNPLLAWLKCAQNVTSFYVYNDLKVSSRWETTTVIYESWIN